MAKTKQPDKLSIEATQALAAGMSYGKWKALGIQADTKQKQEKDDSEYKRICYQCGKEFIRYHKKFVKFCSYECRCKAHYRYVPKGRVVMDGQA